jgi:hypothetical protein
MTIEIMWTCVTYKNSIPYLGLYEGKPFMFKKTSAGNGKYAYASSVQINNDTFTIIHDGSVNIVVIRNNEDDIYMRYHVESKKGIQEMIEGRKK